MLLGDDTDTHPHFCTPARTCIAPWPFVFSKGPHSPLPCQCPSSHLSTGKRTGLKRLKLGFKMQNKNKIADYHITLITPLRAHTHLLMWCLPVTSEGRWLWALCGHGSLRQVRSQVVSHLPGQFHSLQGYQAGSVPHLMSLWTSGWQSRLSPC